MLDEPTPRDLPERTGKHRCIRCLADVELEEFLRNDHLCDRCAGVIPSREDPVIPSREDPVIPSREDGEGSPPR